MSRTSIARIWLTHANLSEVLALHLAVAARRICDLARSRGTSNHIAAGEMARKEEREVYSNRVVLFICCRRNFRSETRPERIEPSAQTRDGGDLRKIWRNSSGHAWPTRQRSGYSANPISSGRQSQKACS